MNFHEFISLEMIQSHILCQVILCLLALFLSSQMQIVSALNSKWLAVHLHYNLLKQIDCVCLRNLARARVIYETAASLCLRIISENQIQHTQLSTFLISESWWDQSCLHSQRMWIWYHDESFSSLAHHCLKVLSI